MIYRTWKNVNLLDVNVEIEILPLKFSGASNFNSYIDITQCQELD